MTTIMNDMDISLMSAAVSSRINAHIKNSSDTPEGILHVGTIDQSSLDMAWTTYRFPPTLIIPSNNDFGWSVRVGCVGQIGHEKLALNFVCVFS